MIFYRPRGANFPAVQWNPATNSTLYEFTNGICETDDPAAIEKLQELGASTEPISTNQQQAMEIMADLTKPSPPPPPKERSVPDREPKVTLPPKKG